MANETTYAGTISKIRVSDGNIYEIADRWARQQIEAITGGSAVVFKGVSSTALTDGGNENPTVGGQTVTSKSVGDLYFVGNDEYIYGADQKWHWLGNQLGQLGDLAYKNSAEGSYTPAGTVSQPTFSGAATTLKGGVTPAGTVTQPTFNGTASTVNISYTPAGTVSKPDITVTAGTKAINYVTGVGSVPTWSSEVEDETLMFTFTQGSVPSTASINATTSVSASLASSPTFSGTATTLKGGYTPSGTVSQPSFNGTASTVSISYTPSGTVSQPTFSGTSTTITVS